MWVNVLLKCMSVQYMNTECPQRSEEGVGPPWNWSHRGCESPCGCWGSAAESSLQPRVCLWGAFYSQIIWAADSIPEKSLALLIQTYTCTRTFLWVLSWLQLSQSGISLNFVPLSGFSCLWSLSKSSPFRSVTQPKYISRWSSLVLGYGFGKHPEDSVLKAWSSVHRCSEVGCGRWWEH